MLNKEVKRSWRDTKGNIKRLKSQGVALMEHEKAEQSGRDYKKA